MYFLLFVLPIVAVCVYGANCVFTCVDKMETDYLSKLLQEARKDPVGTIYSPEELTFDNLKKAGVSDEDLFMVKFNNVD